LHHETRVMDQAQPRAHKPDSDSARLPACGRMIAFDNCIASSRNRESGASGASVPLPMAGTAHPI
jgi:hypothetical protein